MPDIEWISPSPITLEHMHARLEPLSLQHADDLFEARRDVEIWRYVPTPPPGNVAEMATPSKQIRDCSDPIRPALVFCPINALFNEPVQLTPDDLTRAESISVIIDFEPGRSIMLVNEYFDGLADSALIMSFHLSRITTGFGDLSFQASASDKFGGLSPEPESEPIPEPTVRMFNLDRGDQDGDVSPVGIAPSSARLILGQQALVRRSWSSYPARSPEKRSSNRSRPRP